MEPTWTSIVPPLLAVVLAFATREAVFSLSVACLAGVVLMGQGVQGFPALVTRALGTPDFVWVAAIEVCIGVLVAFFQRSGAIDLFRTRVGRWVATRRQAGFLGWVLGVGVFFSDYFSPLFVGSVMRGLTDRYRISREKLAYICDSTSAPVSVLVPFSAWAAYMAGLAATAIGADRDVGLQLFVRAVPYNFYALVAVGLVAVIVLDWVPDFGPMRTAEARAIQTGKLLRDGAVPMMGRELTDLEASSSGRSNLLLNFVLPVVIIVGTNAGTFALTGRTKVLESFMLATAVLGVVLWLQRVDTIPGLMQTAMAGMKGVMPAVIILALAYCINTLTKDMKTAEYVVRAAQPWMAPAMLPCIAFVVSAVIAFATGTSWGTYAIMMPIVIPMALATGGAPLAPMVAVSFAAVAGGGVFGDHCSPLSDTTVLSSLGSACDHIDHARTQLPYALAAAGLSAAAYLVVGLAIAR